MPRKLREGGHDGDCESSPRLCAREGREPNGAWGESPATLPKADGGTCRDVDDSSTEERTVNDRGGAFAPLYVFT